MKLSFLLSLYLEALAFGDYAALAYRLNKLLFNTSLAFILSRFFFLYGIGRRTVSKGRANICLLLGRIRHKKAFCCREGIKKVYEEVKQKILLFVCPEKAKKT